MTKYVPGTLLLMHDDKEMVFLRYQGSDEFVCFRADHEIGKEIVEVRKLTDITTRRVGI